MGHHQQPCVSDPGFATAAAFGWCVDAHDGLDADELAAVLDVHCYDDPAGVTGHAVVGLGQAYQMVVPRPPNMSALALPYFLPQWRMGKAVTAGLSPTDLEAVQALVDDTAARARRGPGRNDPTGSSSWTRSSPPGPSCAWPVATWCCGWRETAAWPRWPTADRATLATELEARIGEYRRLWLERFRPGGLTDSTAWFEHLLGCYRTGSAPSGRGSAPSD